MVKYTNKYHTPRLLLILWCREIDFDIVSSLLPSLVIGNWTFVVLVSEQPRLILDSSRAG